MIQPFGNSTLDLVARSGESCVVFWRLLRAQIRDSGGPSPWCAIAPYRGPRLAITVAQCGTWIIIRGVTRYVLVMKRCMS